MHWLNFDILVTNMCGLLCLPILIITAVQTSNAKGHQSNSNDADDILPNVVTYENVDYFTLYHEGTRWSPGNHLKLSHNR